MQSLVRRLRAERVDVEFTIIPDVLQNPEQTLYKFYRYLEYFDDPSATGVVNADDFEVDLATAKEMLSAGVKRLAIPRMTSYNRSLLVGALTASGITDVKYHFLGASWPYWDETNARYWDRIVSCDTAEPVNAAINGNLFPKDNFVESYEVNTQRRPDYLRLDRMSQAVKTRMNQNVERMASWLQPMTVTRSV